jgi:hypothetical protein
MKRPPQSTRAGCSLFLLLLLGVSIPAAAQSNATSGSSGGAKWGLIDGVGYGGLGFGLGVAATWNMESDNLVGPPGEALVIIGASTVAGTILGAIVGTRAQRTIAARRSLEGAHRIAVIGGAVTAGATLGALASVPLIKGQGEGTALGSDEQTFTLLVLAGGALGALYVWKHRSEFSSRNINLAPEITGDGEYGLRVRVIF